MAASKTEFKAEPNLTPLLDVVFQLITFFMLVINFSSDNYDKNVKLPVADSARPIDDPTDARVDRLVLNIDRDGRLLEAGEAQPLHKAMQTLKRQADFVKFSLKVAGGKPDAGGGLPTIIVLRVDRDADFQALNSMIKACQANGFRKFAFKAMSGPS